MRYVGSVVTTNVTDLGTKFKDIPDVYVILVSRFDPFGGGRAIYHIHRVVAEMGKTVDNGLYEIYINAAVDDGSPIAELMKIFTEDTYYSDKFPATSKRKRLLKTTEKGATEMSEELRRFIAEETAASEARGEARGKEIGKKLGKEIGEKQGKISTLCNLAKEGLLSVAIAAKKAGMSKDAFRKMAML